MWCSREMIINMKSKLDRRQQPFDSMRTECIIVLSPAQKLRIITCSCLCRVLSLIHSQLSTVPHGNGPTAVLPGTSAGGHCGSLHPVCLLFLPRESEVWGWEREATVCLRLSPLPGAFQPGCSHGAGVQSHLWSWTDTPVRLGLLPVAMLYSVAA